MYIFSYPKSIKLIRTQNRLLTPLFIQLLLIAGILGYNEPLTAGKTEKSTSPYVEYHHVQPETITSQTQHPYVDKTASYETTVKALLVTGLDAPCNTYAETIHMPVRLRILENGFNADLGCVNLKGGILLGMGFAHLLDERVYIKLESLTLFYSHPKGSFVTKLITGYVSDENAKTGLKGNLIHNNLKRFGRISSILQINPGRIVNVTFSLE